MISQVGLALSRLFQRTAPDPFVIAILLTLLTALLALTWGDIAAGDNESRYVTLLDAWAGESGLWRFLAFGMQMCLVLVTGHALASTRPVQHLINTLAELPQSTASAATLVASVACLTGLINWGLGLIVGALFARDVGRSLHRRGIRAHYPLICAAGYSALLVWHGGLSGSAPLTMSNRADATRTVPDMIAPLDVWAQTNGGERFEGVGLDQTLFGSMNLIITLGLVILVPLLYRLLAPTRDEELLPIDQYDVVEPVDTPTTPGATVPERMENSPVLAWLLALPLVGALGLYASTTGLANVGLNQINMAMLALGLMLHGSPRAYMNAVTDGARGCAGILVQFPLYGGIMGMMVAAGLVGLLADTFIAVGNETTIPVLSFLAAGVTNLFVPSGGGQWAIQGPIALQTGLDLGIEPAKMIMAVAYGDQLTNMLQPFWALPLLAITGVRARDIVGYTAIVMLVAALWITLGLLVL